MRLFVPCRQCLAASAAAAISVLALTSLAQPASADGVRECLMQGADQLFDRLATAIGSGEADPATIDDARIARETDPIIAKCTNGNAESAVDEIAAFRAHMARWSYHLDRKLSLLLSKGSHD